MTRIRRRWLMAAGVFLGVAAGSARTQELEILPSPKSLPAFVQPNGPNFSEPATAGFEALPLATRRERRREACQKHCIGYAEEFEALPLGDLMHRHFQIQVTNGEAARMVLYHFDFVGQSANLNVRGKDQLVKIMALLNQNFFPIVIERTPGNPALAEARRLAILNELAKGPLPVPPLRVVIGPPSAIGLGGLESEIIHFNMLRQTLSGGAPGAGFGGGGTGGGLGAGGSLGTSSPSTPTLP